MRYFVNDILEPLEKLYPYELALGFDNPGLQVGRRTYPVDRVAVALDVTDEVIKMCVEKEIHLLLTHHPLMLGGIKQVTDSSLAGRRALTLAEHQIAHFAMHTNYDVVTMGDLAADYLGLTNRRILEVTSETEERSYGIGVIGTLPAAMTAEEVCRLVKDAFRLDGIRLFGEPENQVQEVAVSPGSGRSMIAPALASGAQLLITGDIGHHEGLDAVQQGMLVADAGHYGIEHIFVRQMADWLRAAFPDLPVEEVSGQKPFLTI